MALRTETRIGSRSSRCESACGADERAGLFDVGGAAAVGEEAVVADAREALRNDVHEEAAEELNGRELHRLLGIAVVVVAILEGDALAVEGGDAPVRDGQPGGCRQPDTRAPARDRRRAA